VRRGLDETAAAWEPIRRAFEWVHRVARVLKNDSGCSGREVRQRCAGLLGAMRRHRDRSGALVEGLDHVRKVSASYWPGLFHCYDNPDLPRTNNDLEHLFGSHRHHERRATGRKTASPSTVLRGSVRVIAATATRLQAVSDRELAIGDVEAWRELRRRLDQRRHARIQRSRFRRDPQAYLLNIEQQFLQQALPS